MGNTPQKCCSSREEQAQICQSLIEQMTTVVNNYNQNIMQSRAPRKPISLNDYVRSQIDENKPRKHQRLLGSSGNQNGVQVGKVRVAAHQQEVAGAPSNSSQSNSIPGIPSSEAQKFIRNQGQGSATPIQVSQQPQAPQDRELNQVIDSLKRAQRQLLGGQNSVSPLQDLDLQTQNLIRDLILSGALQAHIAQPLSSQQEIPGNPMPPQHKNNVGVYSQVT